MLEEKVAPQIGATAILLIRAIFKITTKLAEYFGYFVRNFVAKDF